MNCANHPERPATSYCRDCGKAMCQECQHPALGSIYCAEHAPVRAEAIPPQSSPVITPPPPRSSFEASPYAAPATVPPYDHGGHPILAFILGFIPGVGAIFNGQYAKGLIHAVVFGLLVTLASREHGALEPLIGLMIAAWVFYMAFEAYHTARKRKYGVAVEEFSSLFDVRPSQGRFPVGGLLLIALGFVLLLDTTEIIDIDQLARYWPAGLIVLGVYLLYSRLSADVPKARPENGADHHAGVGR